MIDRKSKSTHAALACSTTGVVRRECRPALVIAFAVSMLVSNSFAQQTQPLTNEYTVKAAYIYNFTRYIKWPASAFASATSPFVIAVFGEVPPELRRALELYREKKQAQGRDIAVRYLSGADELIGCHLVFVRNSLNDGQVDEVVQTCGLRPILLVGESQSFVEQGGSITFTIAEEKISFRLALGATAGRELQPDAKLLRVGDVVK